MNPLDEVPVVRAHLEEIYRVLQASRGYHAANDLAENFRTLSPNPNSKASRLTVSLNRSVERLEEYLWEDEEDVDE